MIEAIGIRKSFGPGAPALDGADLSIADGEFFCLLGPSGCGKTTLLRVVAGLEKPDAGTIKVGGRDVTSAQPHARGCALVFQNYALWPHLSVAENIGYGLEVQRMPKAEIRAAVAALARTYQLDGLEARFPHQLSGGQQQRVALARAMAVKPHALLMDEPLSNLDAALRKTLRRELLEFHRREGSTVLYVTHDQEEALALSDRLAVMRAGRIVDQGRPRELYSRPATLETALFLGDMNSLRGAAIPAALREGRSEAAVLCVRPEHMRPRLAATGNLDATCLRGTVAFAEFLGTHVMLGVETPSGRILARTNLADAAAWPPGTAMDLELPEEHRLWY